VADGALDEDVGVLIERTEILLAALRVRQRLQLRLSKGASGRASPHLAPPSSAAAMQEDKPPSRYLASSPSRLPYPPSPMLSYRKAAMRPLSLPAPGATDATANTINSSSLLSTKSEPAAKSSPLVSSPELDGHAARLLRSPEKQLPFPLPVVLPAKRPLSFNAAAPASSASLGSPVPPALKHASSTPSRAPSRAPSRPVSQQQQTTLLAKASQSSPDLYFGGRVFMQNRIGGSPGGARGLGLQPVSLTLTSVSHTSTLPCVTSTAIGMSEEWKYVRTESKRGKQRAKATEEAAEKARKETQLREAQERREQRVAQALAESEADAEAQEARDQAGGSAGTGSASHPPITPPVKTADSTFCEAIMSPSSRGRS